MPDHGQDARIRIVISIFLQPAFLSGRCSVPHGSAYSLLNRIAPAPESVHDRAVLGKPKGRAARMSKDAGYDQEN
jgi:hypothetical protein